MNEPTDTPAEKQPEQTGASKRYFRALRILQLLRKRMGRLFIAFVIVVLLFAGMAMTQHWFVHAQLYETTKQELGSWAAEVSKEIVFKDKWDLEGYRRASITAPRWYVVTKDGLIVDIEGFIPGLFGHVELPDDSVYSAPQTVVSAVGEKWRLLGRKVTGGIVVVGICSPENASDADAKLVSNAAKFGSTLAGAESTSSREIDFTVDYAVVSSAGELKAAWGGLPLKTDAHALPLPPDHLAPLTSGGNPYLLYFRPILDSGGRQVGAVIIPKDMTLPAFGAHGTSRRSPAQAEVPRPGKGSWKASTIPKSCIGTMNLDVEQAFQSCRGGIHRPFQPCVLSGDSKVARTRRQECPRCGETVRGQDVRVSKTRGMRMVELPQKIRPALKAGLIQLGL